MVAVLCSFQYRLQGLLELGPGCGRCHLPYQAYTPGYSPELFTMASGDTDRRVSQLMDKDGGDLHRQQVFRLAQVGSGRMKISKCRSSLH